MNPILAISLTATVTLGTYWLSAVVVPRARRDSRDCSLFSEADRAENDCAEVVL